MDTKYHLILSNKSKKDIKALKNQPKKLKAIGDVLDLLALDGYSAIPSNMRAHKLSGNYSGYWECHIMPDLLIIWEQDEQPEKEIYIIRIGTHAALFK